MCPENPDHNDKCPSENHINHMCYLFAHGIDENEPEEFIKEMMVKPRFQCHICGRKTNSHEQVCMPVQL